MSRRDTYYFPHEYNAKDDPKCERLIWEMGMEGYGMFWALLEVLRAQPDYTYPVANIPIVAKKYNADREKMRSVVFDFGLFSIVEDRIFFSNGLTSRMRVLDDRRKRFSEAGKRGMAERWRQRQDVPEKAPEDNQVNNHLNNHLNNHVITSLLQPYNQKESAERWQQRQDVPEKAPEDNQVNNLDITSLLQPYNIKENKSKVNTKKLSNESKESSADKPRNVAAKRGAFVAPSLEEVREFVKDNGLTQVDPEAFCDYYTANGWMVGKVDMKDWRAAARRWNRNPIMRDTQTRRKDETDTHARYAPLC